MYVFRVNTINNISPNDNRVGQKSLETLSHTLNSTDGTTHETGRKKIQTSQSKSTRYHNEGGDIQYAFNKFNDSMYTIDESQHEKQAKNIDGLPIIDTTRLIPMTHNWQSASVSHVFFWFIYANITVISMFKLYSLPIILE